MFSNSTNNNLSPYSLYIIIIWSLSLPAFSIQSYTCEQNGKVIYQPFPCTNANKLPLKIKTYAQGQDLIIFSKQGKEALVYKLITEGVSPNIADENNIPPLFYALDHQYYSIAKLLIASRANVNYVLPSGLNLLMFFVEKDDKQAVQLLLNNNANVAYKTTTEGNTALLLATMANKTDFVQFLLHKGANPNAANNDGLTPLVVALDNKYANLIEILLQNKANIDQFSRPKGKALSSTPLIHFATFRDETSVLALLRLGANANLANEKNICPLSAAALIGNLNIVRLLLDAGANPKQLTADPQLWEYIKTKRNPKIAELIEEKSNLQ